jgi:hypothetical protein
MFILAHCNNSLLIDGDQNTLTEIPNDTGNCWAKIIWINTIYVLKYKRKITFQKDYFLKYGFPSILVFIQIIFAQQLPVSFGISVRVFWTPYGNLNPLNITKACTLLWPWLYYEPVNEAQEWSQ